jgi:hypothetical protein
MALASPHGHWRFCRNEPLRLAAFLVRHDLPEWQSKIFSAKGVGRRIGVEVVGEIGVLAQRDDELWI